MNRKVAIVVSIAALFGAAGVGVYFVVSSGGVEEPVVGQKVVSSGRETKVKVKGRPRPPRERTGWANKKAMLIRTLPKGEVNVVLNGREIETKLTGLYKEVLAELQAALDAEDRNRMLKIVRRMQKSDEWPDGIPSELHKAAIEALAHLGGDSLCELSGYLASSDPEVVEYAMDEIEDMVDDPSKSDFERGELVKQFARYVTDSDTLDSLFSQLIDMRNSCAADVMVDVLKNGTDAAKQVLLDEVIEDITDDENCKTVEALEKWKKDNPDDVDDNETYSGDKDIADDEDDD